MLNSLNTMFHNGYRSMQFILLQDKHDVLFCFVLFVFVLVLLDIAIPTRITSLALGQSYQPRCYWCDSEEYDCKQICLNDNDISHCWIHDDVIKWKHVRRYWPSVRGIHRTPMDYPHKDQWREALIFSLMCGWTNGWANNRDASDLRSHVAYGDVIIMISKQ